MLHQRGTQQRTVTIDDDDNSVYVNDHYYETDYQLWADGTIAYHTYTSSPRSKRWMTGVTAINLCSTTETYTHRYVVPYFASQFIHFIVTKLHINFCNKHLNS